MYVATIDSSTINTQDPTVITVVVTFDDGVNPFSQTYNFEVATAQDDASTQIQANLDAYNAASSVAASLTAPLQQTLTTTANRELSRSDLM